MSIKVATLVRSRVIGSAALKAVLLNMADRANDDGGEVYSSKATIAAETELDRATVFRAVNKLLTGGLIVACGERTCRHGFTVVYRIDLEAVERLPAWKDDQSQAATPTSRTARPHQSQAATPTSRTARPHQSQAATPTSRTARPELSYDPSVELPYEQPLKLEGEAEAEADAPAREEIRLGRWTPDALLRAVIVAGEANPGHRNWRNPAVKETVWDWLAIHSITPEELLEIIRGSRRGHGHERPNSPQAFLGDIRDFVQTRAHNEAERAFAAKEAAAAAPAKALPARQWVKGKGKGKPRRSPHEVMHDAFARAAARGDDDSPAEQMRDVTPPD